MFGYKLKKEDLHNVYYINIISEKLEIEDFSTTLFAVDRFHSKNMMRNQWNNIKNLSKIIFEIDDIITRYLNPIKL